MDDRWLTDNDVDPRFPMWTRANAGDVFPDPVTPLMWTFYILPGLAPGLRDAYISFGMLEWDEFTNPEQPISFSCHGGYLYNPLSATRMMGARMPGATPDAIDKAYFDDRPDVPPYKYEEWHDSPRAAAKLTDTATWVMTTPSIPDLDVEKAIADGFRDGRPDLTAISDAALLARARSVVPFIQQSFETGMIASMGASLGPGAIGGICEALGRPELAITAVAGVEVDSAKPSFAMWDLSRQVVASPLLNAAFDAGIATLLARLEDSGSPDARRFVDGFGGFLAAYGSRGPKEWDLNARVWELYPEVALAAIDRMRVSPDSHSPKLRHDAAVAEREAAIGFIRGALAGDAEALGGFEAALRSAHLFLAGRERYKTTCIKLVHEIRMCFAELGRRAVERGHLDRWDQIFMLLSRELDAFRHEPARFGEILRRRESDYLALYDLEPPFIVNGSVPPMSSWSRRTVSSAAPVAVGDVLAGTAGSGGSATGRARVVHDPGDISALEPGDVMIAPQTDPSWTPLFLVAGAVVVDVGAAGSHAMIVSRDLGIPCVASVVDATRRIPDGAVVTVDGNRGTVTIDSLP